MKIKLWWENCTDRDRRILIIGGISAGLLIFYALIWGPLFDAVHDQKQQVIAQRQLLSYLEKAEKTVASLQSAGIQLDGNHHLDLATLVQKTIVAQGLTAFLKETQQSKTNQVTLVFENVPFDQLIGWMQMLITRHDVVMIQFAANRLPVSGTANAKVVLGADRFSSDVTVRHF